MKSDIKKIYIFILGLIGLFSGVVTLLQAYSFTQIKKVHLEYYPMSKDHYPTSRDNDWFEFISDITSNVGNIVLLDFNMATGSVDYKDRRHPFTRRQVDTKSIGWHFDSCSFTTEINRALGINRQCAFAKWDKNDLRNWDETTKIFDRVFSDGRVSWDSLKRSIPDNGLTFMLAGNGQAVNPFSSFEIETEGYDVARGPYQISASNRDANIIIRISPAPYTKELSAQVKCAKKDWPDLVKFFICPFL